MSEVGAQQAKNVQPFWAILYILSNLGKTYAYFYQLGKNMHFIPFSIIFFPHHVIWPYFCPEKYAPLGRGLYYGQPAKSPPPPPSSVEIYPPIFELFSVTFS